MKPYTIDKNIGKPKFKKKKINKVNGSTTKTQSSILEARNANRSRKKSIRQLSRKKIRDMFEVIRTTLIKDDKSIKNDILDDL